MEIKLLSVCPDGDNHVAYLQIVEGDKVLQSNCVPFVTEEQFNKKTDDLLSAFKTKYEAKEAIKAKVLKKLTAVNTAEKEVK